MVTSTIAVGPEAQKTEPAGYWDANTVCTEIVNEHDCPPIVNAKLAVPLVLGVPEIANESEPAPFAKIPEESVAVKPVTSVDEMVCAAYEPPFPTVYGTDALTPLAAVPIVKVPVTEVEPQLMAPIVGVIAEASLMQRMEKPYALLLASMLLLLLLK